jgi:hypothetical protein
MEILNESSTNGATVTPITHQVKAEVKSTISRSLQAELNLNAHLMAESRDKLAVELASTPNIPPQEMLNKIMEIQSIAQQVNSLATSYNAPTSSELTKDDLDSMRKMSDRYGQKVTAKCFGTKQPNVSDLLSGKAK